MKRFKRMAAVMLAGAVAANIGLTAFTTVSAAETVTESESTADTPENDETYTNAAGLLVKLGILTGDENGNLNPEKNVTRAEIAAIILREMNISIYNTYSGAFEDVDESHWAADIIQTAYDNDIINGYDDGTFGPDDEVTYEQAIKMVMCAINYSVYAEAKGGYPSGYIATANDENVTDNVTGKMGEPITRRNVAKLVYNSLTAPYIHSSGVTGANVEYVKDDDITILSEKRDMYYADGIITATKDKSIDASVEIEDDRIAFEGKLMNSELEDPDQYVALYVRLYYRDVDDDTGQTAIYAEKLSHRTQEMTIDARDIEKITTGYISSDTPQIEYTIDGNAGTKKIKLKEQPIIVYNDQPFSLSNFAALTVSDGSGNSLTFDEFITPKEGSVRAIDFTKDGTYDLIFVESYETSVVKTATSLRLQLEYPISFGSIIKLDTDEDDSLNVKVLRDDEEIKLNGLSEGDVVSVRMNANFTDSTYKGEKYITIETVTDFISGTVSSVSDDDGYTAVIDGTEYDIVDNEDVFADVKSTMGTNAKFYFNKFGVIAKVESENIGGLSSGEIYGWLIDVYSDDDGDIMAKLYTPEEGIVKLPLASKIDYWAPDASENAMTESSKVNELINNTTEGEDYFLNVKLSDTNNRVPMRLCKYKTKSSGELTRLYVAVDADTVTNRNAVRVDTSDHEDSHVSSGLFAGEYLLKNAVAQMTVPVSRDDLTDNDVYGYRMASESEFMNAVGDNDIGYHCFFADESDYEPDISVRFANSTNGAVSIDEYGTADDNPIILVSSVAKAIDEDYEEIYIIKGYRDGEEVEYTTTRNVLVAQVNPAVRLDKKTYDATTIWTSDSDESLTDVIHQGDICGIDGSTSAAQVVLRFVDTQGLAKYLLGGGTKGGVPEGQFRYDESFSSSRDRVIFGYVTDTATSPIVQYEISVDGSTAADDDGDITEDGSTSISVGVSDLSQAVYFVNITSDGKVKVDKKISDAYEVEPGDYVFMRRFKNDASRELYVIRYGG